MALTRPTTHDRGRQAETAAAAWLARRGLRLLGRNVRTRGGELDLVMRDGDTLVFIEVRARRSTRYGGAAASITATKQQRLIRAARGWLMTHPQHARQPVRFDILAYEGPGEPHWICNAIDAAAHGH